MAFLEKFKQIATGKTAEQRKYEQAASAEIRKRQLEEYYRAKKENDLRVARERAKAEADLSIAKIKQRNTLKKSGTGGLFGGGYSSPVGGASLLGAFGSNVKSKPMPKIDVIGSGFGGIGRAEPTKAVIKKVIRKRKRPRKRRVIYVRRYV